jgi:hypothetical protein
MITPFSHRFGAPGPHMHRVAWFLGLTACAAWGRTLPRLDSLKSLAVSMLTTARPATGAFCESYTLSQVNSCSGENRSTSRAIVKPDGSIARFRYRAWNEDGDAALGEFRGALAPVQWAELLRKIAAMDWVDEPGMPDPSVPPAPTQAIQVLTLSDGKRTVSFSVSGPAPTAIQAGMGRPGILADSAKDTVWAVRVENPRLRIRKDGLRFTGSWKVWGHGPVSILWPGPQDPHGCGKAILEWSGGGEDEPESGAADALRDKGRAYAWKAAPGRPARFELRFGTAPAPKGSKAGKLREFGVLLTPAGSSEPVPLTFFSNRFRF